MTDGNRTNPTMAFWIIGVIALLWNLMGLWAYYSNVTATPDDLAKQFTESQIAMINATPAWATSATAIAVTFGVIASVLLLLRNGLAVPLFIVSFVGVIVQDIYLFGMTDSYAEFGNTPIILQSIVFVVAAFLIWFSHAQKARGVLT